MIGERRDKSAPQTWERERERRKESVHHRIDRVDNCEGRELAAFLILLIGLLMRNKALLLATPAFLVHRLIEPYYSYLKGSSEVDMIL